MNIFFWRNSLCLIVIWFRLIPNNMIQLLVKTCHLPKRLTLQGVPATRIMNHMANLRYLSLEGTVLKQQPHFILLGIQ